MAHVMSRVQASNVPISHSLVECSNCGFSAGTLVLGVHDRYFAVEEAEIAIAAAAWAANADSLSLSADSQPTKLCCSLPGHSE